MPSELKAMIGSPVIATDGETGSVRSFLFDDLSWEVRYLVVDTGSRLGRQNMPCSSDSTTDTRQS
jgi:hypothetical protein